MDRSLRGAESRDAGAAPTAQTARIMKERMLLSEVEKADDEFCQAWEQNASPKELGRKVHALAMSVHNYEHGIYLTP